MNNFEVGQELVAVSYHIDRSLLVAYANASGDQNPIHQNEEFAKSVGLPDVIAHGMLTMALAGRYVSDVAGGPDKVKEFFARFIKPVVVPAGSTVNLIISGKISAIENGTAKIDIQATCDDVKVLGMAKAVISLS
ncbi:MAG: MaoC/PaaZ C-terminal domain-containing protein [Actinomycetes bacterium]